MEIWFFQVIAVSVLLYGRTTKTFTRSKEKKLDGNYKRILLSTNSGSSTLQNGSCLVIYLPSHKLSQTNKTRLGTVDEIKTNS